MSTWQRAEGSITPSALAVKSVRALATTIVGVIQAGAGAVRWCETAMTTPDVAASFLKLFPDTTFLCLHRGLRGVLGEGIKTYPLGLGSSPFWPYSRAHPGNSVATISAYWIACTEPLLEFEAEYPKSCLRIRHEDLADKPAQTVRNVYEYLGLDISDLLLQHHTHGPELDSSAEPDLEESALAQQIPDGMLGKIHELHSRLSYPAWR